MAKQDIDLGTGPDTPGADNLYEAFSKVKDNFDELYTEKIILVSEYTVATLPSASTYDNAIIIVSDETGGRTLATSDGDKWYRVSDGVEVS